MTALPFQAQPTPDLPLVPGKNRLDNRQWMPVFFQLVN
jgi:hypothetical protein